MSSLNPSLSSGKQESTKLPLFSWPVWTILVLFLGLTFLGWRLAVQSETETGKALFQHSLEEVTRTLHTRLGAYEQVLTGGVALFTSMDEVSRSQWRDYVASLEISRRFPGIQGVGYAPFIPADQIERFSQDVRESGVEGFSVTPKGDRESYSSILYLEPFDWRNQRALGYDMFSEPVRRAAMERARDTGRAALSGKVRLVQETDQDIQAGFLIYLPLYHTGVPLETIQQRRDALRGWIYAPFRMGDLMQGLLEGESALLRVDVTDAAVIGDDGLMYSSGTAINPSQYSKRINEQVYGHPWALSFSSMPEFDAEISGHRSSLVLLIGLLIDLLVVALLIMFWLQQQRTYRLALFERTEELAIRLGALIEALPDAIFFKDGEGRWKVVNSSGLQLFGLNDESWKGATDLDLAERYPEMAEAYQNCKDDDEKAWELGERFDTVEEILGQQGVRTFEVTKVPLFKADGSRQGLVVIGRDVSERRANEETERRLLDSLRRLNEIAALLHLPLKEQLRRALAVGNQHLGLEFGIVSHVSGDVYSIVSQVSPPDTLEDNQTFALAETYCSITLNNNEVLAIHDMRGSPYRGHPCYDAFSLETYIGAPIVVNEQVFGTVNFTSPEPYRRKFDEGDHEFVSLLARWVGSVIEVDLAAQQLATNKLKLQTIIDNEPGCVKLLDQEGRLLQMNPAGLGMIDAETQDQVLGLEVSELVLPPYREAFNNLTQRVFAGESGTLEFEICSLKQERRWLETHAVPLRTPEGDISALLAVTLDITKRKATEDEIHRLAFFDPLTNLANRRLLLDRLDQAQRACVRRSTRGALLIIDLDNFKAFNDGLGHGKGDELLQEVAQRLLASVRTDDTVGRIGGDEFVVVLENLDKDPAAAEQRAVAIAEKIRIAIAQASSLDKQVNYPVTASIGLSLFCGDEDENSVLFNHADQALYRAKHRGRNCVQVYQSSRSLTAPI